MIQDCNSLMQAVGVKPKLEKSVNNISNDLADLIAAAKKAAANGNDDLNLLEAAQRVNKEVEDLLACAPAVLENPKNMPAFRKLLGSALKVVNVARDVLGEDAKWAPYDEFRVQGMEAASAATALSIAAGELLPGVKSIDAKKKLLGLSVEANRITPEIAKELSKASKAPREMKALTAAIENIVPYVQRLQDLAQDAHSAVPMMNDNPSKARLNKLADDLLKSSNKLDSIFATIDTPTSRQIQNVVQEMEVQEAKLASVMLNSELGVLIQKVPRAQAVEQLQNAVKELAVSIKDVKKATTAQPLTFAIQNLAKSVENVQNASELVAIGTVSAEKQQAILQSSQQLIPDLKGLIEAARSRVDNRSGDDDVNLNEAAKQLSNTLKDLLSTTQVETAGPECDGIVTKLAKTADFIDEAKGKPAKKATQEELNNANTQLGDALEKMESACDSLKSVALEDPSQLKKALSDCLTPAVAFVKAANQVIELMEPKARAPMVNAAKEVLGKLADAAAASRTASAEPLALQALTTATEAVHSGAVKVLKAAEAVTPGYADIQEARAMLNQLGSLKSAKKGNYNLSTLQEAAEKLQKSIGDIVAALAREPKNAGPVSIEIAKDVASLLDNAKGYNEIVSVLAGTESIKEAVAQIQNASSPKECLAHVKAIAAATPELFKTMKALGVAEKDPNTRKELTSALQIFAPLPQKLLDITKSSGQKGSNLGARDIGLVAQELVDAIESVISASPAAMNAIKMVDSANVLVQDAQQMLTNAAVLLRKPRDGMAQTKFAISAKTVQDDSENVVNSAKDLAVGRSNIENALKGLANSVVDIDCTLISSQLGLLEVPSKSFQAAQEAMVTVAKGIVAHLQSIAEATKSGNMLALARAAGDLEACVADVARSAKEMAATTQDEKLQQSTLEQAKAVAQTSHSLMEVALSLSSDSNSAQLQKNLLSCSQMVKTKLEQLLDSLKVGVLGLRACDDAAKKVNTKKNCLTEFPTFLNISFAKKRLQQ